MRKQWFWALAALCAAALAISIFWMAGPALGLHRQEPPTAEADIPYLLRDNGGRIALYRQGETEPVKVYELYTHLLPQPDVLSLQKGIPVESEEELARLLEDFGL